MAFFLQLIYLVFTFVRPGELVPELSAFPLMGVLGGVALVATVFATLAGRGSTLRAPQLYIVAFLVLWAMFSVLAAQHWLGGAVAALGGLSGVLTPFVLIVLNVDSLRRFRITAALLCAIGVYLGGQGIASYHFGFESSRLIVTEWETPGTEALPDDESDGLLEDSSLDPTRGAVHRIRNLGFLNDPNDLAQALVALLPFVFAFWRPGRLMVNAVLVALPASVMVYGAYLTRSRGGACALLVVLFLGLRRSLGRLGALAVTLTGGVILIAGDLLAGRTLSIDESTEGRLGAWSEGLQMLKSSPLWGVGFGAFTDHHDLVAHNSFVHCFAELGLVGYFVWLALLAVTLVELNGLTTEVKGAADHEGQEFRRWGEACLISLLAFLAGAIFLSRSYSVMLFLIIGLGTALANVARREGRELPALHPAAWLVGVVVFEVGSILLVYLLVRVMP